MVTTPEDVKQSSHLYLTKPFAYRVKEPLTITPGTIDRQTMTHCDVGGSPLVFDSLKMHLEMGGSDYDVYQWKALENRINLVLEHAGLLQKVKPASGEWDGKSSKFLTRNWRSLVDQREGTWKKPPWWLRWLYSAVITKEEYG